MQNKQIAEIIKLKCKEQGISVSFLLNSCSINKNFIYDLEKCNKSPSVDKLIKISDFLNCSIDCLIGRA
ncbi:MAG: helix-turn-helix domain-containing protein [Ruminococcus flavefaciens]|nr:helix-turn-helix domain-containing protein [Ruminococcus flavefaciens]